jgi:hypothetical protein
LAPEHKAEVVARLNKFYMPAFGRQALKIQILSIRLAKSMDFEIIIIRVVGSDSRESVEYRTKLVYVSFLTYLNIHSVLYFL